MCFQIVPNVPCIQLSDDIANFFYERPESRFEENRDITLEAKHFLTNFLLMQKVCWICILK